jgi:uncharacterized protein YkwD
MSDISHTILCHLYQNSEYKCESYSGNDQNTLLKKNEFLLNTRYPKPAIKPIEPATKPATKPIEPATKPATKPIEPATKPAPQPAVTTKPAEPAKPASLGKFTEQEKNEILRLHNVERSLVGAEPLVWDTSLEEYAQEWASSKKQNGMQHRVHAERLPSHNKNYGENLAWGASSEPLTNTDSLNSAVTGWNSEKKDYQCGQPFRGNEPDAIGHYTQVVWPSTKAVGCGIDVATYTDVNSDPGYKYQKRVVCNYYPAGNYIGQTPVPPDKCPLN